jgi:hypothetical protein
MSDNLRRYRAIRDALTQYYPGPPTGTVARHLTTLAALISGIVASKSTQLPHIATKSPDGTKPESRVKRFARWLDNERILEELYFLPYAELLLTHLAVETLVLVMDGSGVGRGCMALMMHVIYKGRAAVGVARAARSEGTFSRGTAHRFGGTDRGMPPRGEPGRIAGRRRVRWDHATGDAQQGGLVLCVPHCPEHRGDVGRCDLSPRYLGGV